MNKHIIRVVAGIMVAGLVLGTIGPLVAMLSSK